VGRFSVVSRPIVSEPAMPRPIRVLHVLGSMSRGGVQVRTVELLRHVDRRRYRFHFCVLSGRPGEMDDEARSSGGVVHLLRQGLTGSSDQLRRFFRQHEFDVVHAHLQSYSGYLLRLAAECGVPVRVAHFHSTHVEQSASLPRRLACRLLSPWVDRFAGWRVMRRWLDRHATHILGVSEHALRKAWRTDWQTDPRCEVVYDGVDTSPFAAAADRAGVRREFGLPHDAPLYIHVGRVTKPKNHLRLVSIFAEILRRRAQARLLLVGRTIVGHRNDSLQRRLRRRIAQLGIAEQVVFGGERSDVPRLLKAADALVFPSRWEGLGDVVLEASAAGTPALCSDLPSIREMAARLPGIRCLSLHEPDAAWADAAEAMAGGLPSEPMRRAALETFAGSVFTVQQCARRLCRIWQTAAAGSRRGGAADG